MSRTRNNEVLQSFVDYCNANPELRFWQALKNWSGYRFIFSSNIPIYELHADEYASSNPLILDTYNWEGKRHDSEESKSPSKYCPHCGN